LTTKGRAVRQSSGHTYHQLCYAAFQVVRPPKALYPLMLTPWPYRFALAVAIFWVISQASVSVIAFLTTDCPCDLKQPILNIGNEFPISKGLFQMSDITGHLIITIICKQDLQFIAERLLLRLDENRFFCHDPSAGRHRPPKPAEPPSLKVLAFNVVPR